MKKTRTSFAFFASTLMGLPVLGWAQDSPTPTAPVDLSPPPSESISEAPTVQESAPEETPSPAEAPPQAAAAPPPPAAEAPVSASDVRTPMYQRVRPTWGVQLATSLRAMGSRSYFLAQEATHLRGFSLQGEWQPESLQNAGVFSVGPAFNLYPELPDGGLTSSRTSLWSYGAQVKYQARYFREQPVVPFLGLGLENLNYRFENGAKGHVISVGGVGGVMFLLNALDPSGAAAFYANYKIVRSYLVAEFRGYSGKDINVTLGGSSLFLGLRVEF